MMQASNWLVLGALALAAAACGGNDLSRARAAQVLDATTDFSSTSSVRLHPGGPELGARHRRWGDHASPDNRLTSVASQSREELTLTAPVGRTVVQVTGIADAPMAGMKEALFDWAYRDVPPEVRWYVVQGGTGRALFRLYDDGWRVESIDLHPGSVPFALTADDKEQLARYEKELEQARLASLAAERAERERAQAKAEQQAALIERSKQPTRTILAIGDVRRYGCSDAPGVAIEITDAGIHVPVPPGCKWYADVETIPFHDTRDISTFVTPAVAEIRFRLGQRYLYEEFKLKFRSPDDAAMFVDVANKHLTRWRRSYPFGERG